jgi:hypothetical protein
VLQVAKIAIAQKTRKGKVSSPDHVINKFARSGTQKAQRGQKTL